MGDDDDTFPYYTHVVGAVASKSNSRHGRVISQVALNSGICGKRPRPPNKPRTRRSVPKLQEMQDAQIGQTLPTAPLKLPIPLSCVKCGARKFAFESPNFCCGNGEIELFSNAYPPELVRLFTSREEDAIHFKKYIRLYNNLFAFSSLGGKIDAQTLKGIYVFKLHGQIYHYVPDLLPNADDGPKYLQLYFYDGQCETDNRSGCFPELRQDVMDILMKVTQTNPYARFFRTLKEIEITEKTQIIINQNPSVDQRVYNAPTSNEVAVIWSEDTASSQSNSPHIIVSGRSNEPHRIMHYYGCYDPLQYPILFPYGDCGWHQGLKKTKKAISKPVGQIDLIRAASLCTPEQLLEEEARRSNIAPRQDGEKSVSCREYYCYKLQSRPGNLLLRAGRCLQQYIVDMYVKLENTRLDFFRYNQEAIRAELYQGILDTMENGENIAANIGHRVILPPTFLGGPRDMKRRYLNAMALVQRYGKPDLFITMTCNPNWPEIKQELAAGEEAQNRPDIVSRIFRAKLLALKKQIMEQQVFGEVAAIIYVVEFQKRGLPHVHFLIILKPAFKIKTPEDFDKFVSAELPPLSNLYLRKIVLKNMMHGPCGILNPMCPCMKHAKSKDRCKFGFPKPFAQTTTNNTDGYPVYKRSNNGDEVDVRGSKLDNGWVIPYNPYLLSLFDCHLNVEVCSTIQAVKYLYKYVYKGHDKISFNVVPNNSDKPTNEIDQFQSGRWVSPCEAVWRLFGFDLFEMHPPVMPLPVHLPNMQTLQLRPHECLDKIVSNGKRARTPLTEFFKVNSSNPDLGYLYGEFTEHYRWDASSKTWLKRKNKLIVIGRLTFVAPAEGERYFLRLLLLHVRAPKSFEDLLTVNNYRCGTFQEAALKLHLLEEDDAVDLCLKEACEVQMPFALRRLFSTVLTFCTPCDPSGLWLKYYVPLSDDFRNQYPQEPAKVKQLTVRSIEQYLEAMGQSLKAFGMDHLCMCEDDEFKRTRDIVDALDAPVPQECMDCRGKLNKAQQEAFNEIICSVKQGQPGAFFIDGPGGTGKTFLYNALYAEIRLMGKIVLPTATSGIAAANIPSGRTAHSRFKIPIDIASSLSCDVPKQGSLATLLRATTLIIWDEASMARKENIESLDMMLRDICDSNIIFGSKLIVFGGDFRQVLPIVPHKSQREAVAASLVSSFLWPKLKKFRLIENIRAKDDPMFASFLLALGNGELQAEDAAFVQLPGQIVRTSENEPNPIVELTTVAFPELDQTSYDSDIFTTRAILTPINDDVDNINAVLIRKFPGVAVTYRSYDTILDDNCTVYPVEFVNTLCPGGMSPHELVLKENCPVILLRNLLPSYGLCNGTRLLCKRFFPNLIECVITVGHHKGERVFIPRIKLRPSSSSKYPFQFQRKQFPIKLSFAMTINKSQGQTLSQVVVYLPKPCFSPGQLYVALSRARKSSHVTVIAAEPPENLSSTHVKNIISYDVLRLAGIIRS